MATSAEIIKELRNKSGAGFLDCKNALSENNNDDPMTVEAYLIELNNSIGKTERERQIDLETNLGQEIVSELKFSSLGTNHANLGTELKSIKKTSKWSRLRKLLKGSKNTISNQDDVKFQKFD